MNPCIIRFAQADDYKAVEAIMKQVQALHILWRPDIYKEADPVLSYSDFCEAVTDQTFLVAELDHQVVGLLSFLRRHVASDKQVTRDVLFIENMAVDKAHRGTGIGHQFFDFIRKLAQQDHYDGIELQVNARNNAAYEMYKSYGFTEKSINMELL